MTVRMMEGFETTETIADLRARGSTVSSAAFGSMLPISARYPQGRAMARSGGLQRFIDKPIGTLRELGGGAFLSMSAMTTPYNSGNATIPTAVQTPHGWVHGVGAAGVNVTMHGTSVDQSGVAKQVTNPSGNNQYNPFQLWYDADRDQIIGRYQYSSSTYFYAINAATLTSAGLIQSFSITDFNASMVYVEPGRPNILAPGQGAAIYVRQVGQPSFVQLIIPSPNNIVSSWVQHTPYGYMAFDKTSRNMVSTTSPNANAGWGNRTAVPLPNAVQTMATNSAGDRTIASIVGGAVYVLDTSTPTSASSEVYLQTLPGTAPANTNVQCLDGNFYVFELDNGKANGGTPTRYWTAAANVTDTTLTWTMHELTSSKFFGGINNITHAPGLPGESSYLIINHVGGNVAFGIGDEYLTLIGGPIISSSADATGFYNGWSNTRLGLNAHNSVDATDPNNPILMKGIYWGVTGPGQSPSIGTLITNQPQTAVQWNNIEVALTSQGNEQYQVDYTQDAVPIGSVTFDYTPLTAHLVYTGGIALTGRIVATDDGTLYAAHAARSAGRGALRSYNWSATGTAAWDNINIYSLNASSTIGRIVTDGSVVLGFDRLGGGGSVFRLDEPAPRILAAPLSGSFIWNAADTDRKGLWMACSNAGSTSPVIWKSEDNGNTWTTIQLPTVPSTVMVSEIVYGENDTWCVFAYRYVFMTKDAGTTWTWTEVYNVASPITEEVVALMPTSTEASGCSGCYGRGKFWYVTTYTRGQVLAIDPSGEDPALAEVFRVYGSVVTQTVRSVAVTDKSIFVTTTANQLLCAQPGHNATTPSATWPVLNLSGAGVPGTVHLNKNIAMASSATTGASAFFLESLLDMPLMVRTQAQSWAAGDDIVVTDLSAPNLGPVGETRIYVVPSDTDVGTPEWVRIPEELPTNAAAATSYPLSETTSRVEAADVGQRDVYGTTSFDYPAGLKPVAMSFEGNFGRLFTNTPVVELGMQVSGEEVTTGPVSITSPLGTTTFASKILDRNPNGNVSWSRDSIPDTELTLTKVG